MTFIVYRSIYLLSNLVMYSLPLIQKHLTLNSKGYEIKCLCSLKYFNIERFHSIIVLRHSSVYGRCVRHCIIKTP